MAAKGLSQSIGDHVGSKLQAIDTYLNDHSGDWPSDSTSEQDRTVDLDAAYSKIIPNSWMVLIQSQLPVVYRVTGVTQLSQTKYAMSGKFSRVTVDIKDSLSTFNFRATHVLAQSEELAVAPRPLLYPLYGTALALDGIVDGLQPDQTLAVSGKRARIRLSDKPDGVSFLDMPSRKAKPAESFRLAAPPQTQSSPPAEVAPEDIVPGSSAKWKWSVLDHDGRPLKLVAAMTDLELQPALEEDAAEGFVIAIAHADGSVRLDLPAELTRLTLAKPLETCLDRPTVTINANVAPATHGESLSEIAGGGDAAKPDQHFVLKQPPLTWVSDGSQPDGRLSTLKLTVNDVTWKEVSTLHDSGSSDRVYTLRTGDDGKTTVTFGDGVQGARLPTGENNVRAAYRKGLGAAGNLRAGQLSNLVTRPAGVKSVTNPEVSTGGQDAETINSARRNAPLRVLTLDRAVSIADYANYAMAFAGIDKACAAWIETGGTRGVHVTVAGTNGAAVEDGKEKQADLIASLRQFGDAFVPLTVGSCVDLRFQLAATIVPAADVDSDKVLAEVERRLREAFAFSARDLGQAVTLDEVYSVIQAVKGVVAADVRKLHLAGDAAGDKPSVRLFARLPTLQPDGTVQPAELLTLDSGPLDLVVST
jgi:baseplate J-like protein